MEAEAIVPLCTHIKTNGSLCRSPALAGEPLCFFHNRLQVTHKRPQDASSPWCNGPDFGIAVGIG